MDDEGNALLTTFFEHEPPPNLRLTNGDHYRALQNQCPRCDQKFLKRINILVDGGRGPEHIEMQIQGLKHEIATLKHELMTYESLSYNFRTSTLAGKIGIIVMLPLIAVAFIQISIRTVSWSMDFLSHLVVQLSRLLRFWAGL